MLYAREGADGSMELLDFPWEVAHTEGLVPCDNLPNLPELKKNPAFFKINRGRVEAKPQGEVDKILEMKKKSV